MKKLTLIQADLFFELWTSIEEMNNIYHYDGEFLSSLGLPRRYLHASFPKKAINRGVIQCMEKLLCPEKLDADRRLLIDFPTELGEPIYPPIFFQILPFYLMQVIQKDHQYSDTYQHFFLCPEKLFDFISHFEGNSIFTDLFGENIDFYQYTHSLLFYHIAKTRKNISVKNYFKEHINGMDQNREALHKEATNILVEKLQSLVGKDLHLPLILHALFLLEALANYPKGVIKQEKRAFRMIFSSSSVKTPYVDPFFDFKLLHKEALEKIEAVMIDSIDHFLFLFGYIRDAEIRILRKVNHACFMNLSK